MANILGKQANNESRWRGKKREKKNNNKKKLDLRKISRIRNGVNAGKKKNLKTSFAAEYL